MWHLLFVCCLFLLVRMDYFVVNASESFSSLGSRTEKHFIYLYIFIYGVIILYNSHFSLFVSLRNGEVFEWLKYCMGYT